MRGAVSRRRLMLLFSLGLIVAVLVPVASVAAAAPKVLLVTRGEEGEGPPAATGEPSHVTTFMLWDGGTEGCGGADEAAVLGTNPAPTVKVTGSNVPLGNVGCFGASEASGSIAIKSVSLSKKGVVTMLGRFEIQTSCHYRATKLTGTYNFAASGEGEEQFIDQVSGIGKLVKKGSGPECAATTSVEGSVAATDAAGYNYLARLTS